MLQEIRLTIRRLLRAPMFTSVALLTLAVGIGANTALFTVVNAVLLRPAPGIDPARLVFLYTSDFSGPLFGTSSYPDFESMRAATDVFERAAVFTPSVLTVAIGSEPMRIDAELVSEDYFDAAGVRMSAGRAFGDDEAVARGIARSVVISERLFRQRFGGDARTIGRTITVNGQQYTVTGVAGGGFRGLTPGMRAEVWAPIQNQSDFGGSADLLTSRGSRGVFVMARLRANVTLDAARARMEVLRRQLQQADPDSWTDVRRETRRITVLPESEARVPPQLRAGVTLMTGILTGVVMLVLLICCANVANLVLARASARAREMAIRTSLGATGTHLVRAVVVESVTIAVLGAAGGMLLARWCVDLLPRLLPRGPFSFAVDLTPDLRVIAFTLATSLFAALVSGLLPMLRRRASTADALRAERVVTGSGRRPSVRDALVVLQLAISVVLLTGALLLIRTVRNAAALDTGIDSGNVFVAAIDFPREGTLAGQLAVLDAIAEQLRAAPGVRDVTSAQRVPLSGARGRRGVAIEGYAPQPGEEMEFPFNVVAPNYFSFTGLPIVSGRSFTADDRVGAPEAVIVNETFARRFFPAGDALGRLVTIRRVERTIVGVARDSRYWSIGEPARPYFYIPSTQEQVDPVLHVRTAREPLAIAPAVRAAVGAHAPGAVITLVDTMERQMSNAVAAQRFAANIIAAFALLAGLLAVVGIYGVTAYVVAQRIPEIGVRMALGAQPLDVARLVLARGLVLGGVGATLGAAAALAATRTLRALLFGVAPHDPATFATVTALLLTAALIASYLPARRASRVDPLIALRS